MTKEQNIEKGKNYILSETVGGTVPREEGESGGLDSNMTEGNQWFPKLAEAAMEADSQASLTGYDAAAHPRGL